MDKYEFLTEKKDYSIPEFYDRFHKCLPKIFEVNQGVCNDKDEEAFAKGEVIVIGSISRQKRVITQLKINEKTRFISIPETYGEKLCLVKKGTPGREDTLMNILAHNKLPITVCFPRNRTITLGVKTLYSNRIPHLTVTETFDEVYLLGNYINNGELCSSIVTVPLYLSQLRVSIVNGIKGHNVSVWKTYKRWVNSECSRMSYTGIFGNQDIAEYDPKAVHAGKDFSYLEPMTYENIVNLINPNNQQAMFPDMTPEEIDDMGLYEDVPITDEQTASEVYYNQPENNKAVKNELKAQLDLAVQKATISPQAFPTLEPISRDYTNCNYEGGKGRNRPPVAPKPKLNKGTQEYEAQAPALPVRQKSQYRQTPSEMNTLPHSGMIHYANVRPTTSVAPTVQIRQAQVSPTVQPQQSVRKVYQTLTAPSPEESKYRSLSRSINSKKDVADLSVEEICVYLNALNLSKYEAHFKEHMIDGAMLVELDSELLMEDIGMKRLEVARLTRFAKEGRLPMKNN